MADYNVSACKRQGTGAGIPAQRTRGHAAGAGGRAGLSGNGILLLGRGAEVNARNEWQETALFRAVQYGYVEICEMLLEAGADVQVTNEWDQSLSDVALPRKHAQVLTVLARHGDRAGTMP